MDPLPLPPRYSPPSPPPSDAPSTSTSTSPCTSPVREFSIRRKPIGEAPQVPQYLPPPPPPPVEAEVPPVQNCTATPVGKLETPVVCSPISPGAPEPEPVASDDPAFASTSHEQAQPQTQKIPTTPTSPQQQPAPPFPESETSSGIPSARRSAVEVPATTVVLTLEAPDQDHVQAQDPERPKDQTNEPPSPAQPPRIRSRSTGQSDLLSVPKSRGHVRIQSLQVQGSPKQGDPPQQQQQQQPQTDTKKAMRRISQLFNFRSSSAPSSNVGDSKYGSFIEASKSTSWLPTTKTPIQPPTPPGSESRTGTFSVEARRPNTRDGVLHKKSGSRPQSKDETEDNKQQQQQVPKLAVEVPMDANSYPVPPTLMAYDASPVVRPGTPGLKPDSGRGPSPPAQQDRKLHRRYKGASMIFGVGKPKKDEEEVLPKSWLLEYGSREVILDYDVWPLEKGEAVPDMWDPNGDTLVYFSSPPAAPGPPDCQASFRIQSSPLLFSALGHYVQNLNTLPTIPAEESTLEEEEEEEGDERRRSTPLRPNDLFLEIPGLSTAPSSLVNGESGMGQWGQLGEMIRGTSSTESETAAAEPEKKSPSPIVQEDQHSASSSSSPEVATDAEPDVQPGPSQRSSTASQPGKLSPPQGPLRSPAVSEGPQARYKVYYPTAVLREGSAASRRTRFLDTRNMFAFLDRKPLVGSSGRINAFQVLEKIYLQLFIEASAHAGGVTPAGSRLGSGKSRLGTPPRTSSPLGSPASFGSPASLGSAMDELPAKIMMAESHLEHYIDELKLDDVRSLSGPPRRNPAGLRDCMEAMYIGEKWRCSRLFLQGYLHTVGRWEEIKDRNHPLIDYFVPTTLSKLDRAALDLKQRQNSLMERFAGPAGELAFPSMFVGLGKYPQFKPWKAGFGDTRKLVLNHFRWVYGSWPPRAGRKGKGGGSGGKSGGFNREVLKRIERDMGALWDLIVDWDRPRYPPGGFSEGGDDTNFTGDEANDLRALLEEFDKSSPPVQPRPMFDMPRLPSLPEGDSEGDKKDKKKKKPKKPKKVKVKGEAAAQLIKSSWNVPATPEEDTAATLVEEFKRMEITHASGKTVEEIQEMRKGRWIFIYAVLQSLPMLVVDAPLVRFFDGVEYFLCVGWKGATFPWEDGRHLSAAKKGPRSRRVSVMWASAPGNAAVNSPVVGPGGLGGDLFAAMGGTVPEDDEVASAYHRSYCWLRAATWCMAWEEKRRKEQEEARVREETEMYRRWEADRAVYLQQQQQLYEQQEQQQEQQHELDNGPAPPTPPPHGVRQDEESDHRYHHHQRAGSGQYYQPYHPNHSQVTAAAEPPPPYVAPHQNQHQHYNAYRHDGQYVYMPEHPQQQQYEYEEEIPEVLLPSSTPLRRPMSRYIPVGQQ